MRRGAHDASVDGTVPFPPCAAPRAACAKTWLCFGLAVQCGGLETPVEESGRRESQPGDLSSTARSAHAEAFAGGSTPPSRTVVPSTKIKTWL
ncbi:hypothetical protein MTO96_006629 [Rhipicephalus appendiculatus]